METSAVRNLTIVLNNLAGKIEKVTQNGNKIPVLLSKEKIIIEADPTAGPVLVSIK